MPPALQTLGWWTRPVALLEGCHARYGKRFTMRLLQTPPFVHHSEPEQLREILFEGSKRARAEAVVTMERVRDAVKITYK